MEHAFSKDADEVAKFFGTDVESGLTEAQVDRLQKKYGPNGECFSLVCRKSFAIYLFFNLFKRKFLKSCRPRRANLYGSSFSNNSTTCWSKFCY
jgi:hypothetical protein